MVAFELIFQRRTWMRATITVSCPSARQRSPERSQLGNRRISCSGVGDTPMMRTRHIDRKRERGWNVTEKWQRKTADED